MSRMKKLTVRRAESLAAGADYIEAQATVPADGFGWLPGTQHSQQFSRIQPMAAHDGTVQKQDRHIQPVAALQVQVAVHVDDLHRRQRLPPPQGSQLCEHLVAQLTVLAMHYGEAECHKTRPLARVLGDGLVQQRLDDEADGGGWHFTHADKLVSGLYRRER